MRRIASLGALLKACLPLLWTAKTTGRPEPNSILGLGRLGHAAEQRLEVRLIRPRIALRTVGEEVHRAPRMERLALAPADRHEDTRFADVGCDPRDCFNGTVRGLHLHFAAVAYACPRGSRGM